MRVCGLVVMLLATSDQSIGAPMPGVYELYQTAQTFLGTLNTILEEGIAETSKIDKDFSERLAAFQYDWLSVVGYNKGLMPLVSDFFFNYHENKEFIDKNGKLVSSMKILMASFRKSSNVDELYKNLQSLLKASLEDRLFHEGTIHTFLLELKTIVDDHAKCNILLARALEKKDQISELLHFLLVGTPAMKESSKKTSSKTEL